MEVDSPVKPGNDKFAQPEILGDVRPDGGLMICLHFSFLTTKDTKSTKVFGSLYPPLQKTMGDST